MAHRRQENLGSYGGPGFGSGGLLRGGTGGSRAAVMETKPFEMPPDDEVFTMRGQERALKQAEREEKAQMKVQDKTTFSSRIGQTAALDPEMRTWKNSASSSSATAASMLPMDHRRREKENMADFIAKKREIFLVQMSLDTKRAEIRKLEERALQREEALRKSEQMLEEGALRFDAFLKENDEKVQEAIKRAEVEAKAKQDKVLDIKRLNGSIGSIRSELNKYEEQLEDCKKYKAFLDRLTPQEWFQDLIERKRLQVQERKAEHERVVAEIRQTKAEAQAKKTKADEDLANAGTQQEAEAAEMNVLKLTELLEEAMQLKEPQVPESWDDPDDQEEPMYFKNPQQLLDIFGQLEEQNLFLIQNVQETEEALEELKNKYRETRLRMEAETDSLRQQISSLEDDITMEEDKGVLLMEKTNENALGLRKGGHTITLESLSTKVADVYNRCGFDSDASMSTLQMLTNIESKLEEYLTVISGMPSDFVEASEKAKEKERRQRAREEKIEQQKREQERRTLRALERAQAPVHKKTGKPVMFRSAPIRKKKVTEAVQKDTEEAQLDAYMNRDF